MNKSKVMVKRIMVRVTWDYQSQNEIYYECNPKGIIILKKKCPRNYDRITADLKRYSKPFNEAVDHPIPILQINSEFNSSQKIDQQFVNKIQDIEIISDEEQFNNFEDDNETNDSIFSTFDLNI